MNSAITTKLCAKRFGISGKLLLLSLCLFVTACGSLPSSYRKTQDKLIRDVTTASHYRKKIGVAPILNFSYLKGRELDLIFEKTLINTIQSECKNAEMVTPESPESGGFLAALPELKSGIIDNFSLSNGARAEGYNAIVTGALTTITSRKERTGIWWWRKDHYYLTVLIFIDVYDPYDAAKVYSEPIITEFAITANEADRIKKKEGIDISRLSQVIEEMGEQAGTKVCAAVQSRIWKGFVIESVQNQVTISCGRVRGVRSGDQFEVYDSARSMEGYGGEKFFIPGYKIGEIEINRVDRDQAYAKVLTQTPLPVGSVVIPKY